MITLVSGDRYWNNRIYLYDQLDYMHDLYHITKLVQGEAPGADTMAAEWAEDRDIPLATREPWIFIPSWHQKNLSPRGYPALWHLYGKPAGPRRNKEMLDKEHPELGIAFHDKIETSKGTKNMIELMKKAHVPRIHLFSALKGEEIEYFINDLSLGL